MSDYKNKQVIFISGRFRSGTSMLWNIFDSLENYQAWYEPLHPNLISHIQHVKPKKDHLGIDDYWHSYVGLKQLAHFHSPEFGQNRIFLEKKEKWPELKTYIDYLITESGDKTPVLQFNRMDLRLSWLRNQYPNSKIIHIHREPISLWSSNRKHLSVDQRDNESHQDAYDLMQWSCELAPQFPMLIAQEGRSGFFRHYFIWKLSRKIAITEANLKLNLIDDFHKSDKGLKLLSKEFQWTDSQFNKAKECVYSINSSEISADDQSRLQKIESQVDIMFKDLGLESGFPSSLLESIKCENKKAWGRYSDSPAKVTQELLRVINWQKDELTAALNQSS